MTSHIPVIAIDGPSASGKGTVASRVAAELGFEYLDSGSLYRIAALAARQADVDLDDEHAVAAVVRQMDVSFLGETIRLGAQDVTSAIRTEEAGIGASKIAVHPDVRAALTELQRAFRRGKGLVADGRDMGSVIFPDARLKVFLTASAEQRANRRYKQLIGKGETANISQILQDIELRDARDMARPVAPLMQLPDAQLLDTTELSIEQAVKKVLDWYQSKD